MFKFSVRPCSRRRLRFLTAAAAAVVLTSSMIVTGIAAPVPETTVSATGLNPVVLTEEEQAFLAEHPTIIVSGDASWRPLEYAAQDGTYRGVLAEILTRLSNYTGITFEYAISDNYNDSITAVQDGTAYLSSGLACDEQTAADYNMLLSDPYLTINSAIVSKHDFSGLYKSDHQLQIAVVDGDYTNAEIESSIGNAELILCSSNEECLDLIKRDAVDAAIIASYCAEYYSSIPKYSTLKSHTIPDFDWQLSFAMSDQQDPRLLSILNKGIGRLKEVDINEAVYEGLVGAAYDNDLMFLIYKHPILFTGVTSAIVLSFAALMFILYTTTKRADARRIEDGTRLRLALERTHLCIWELDLSSGSITQVDNPQERHGFGDQRMHIPKSVIEAGLIHPDDVSLVEEAVSKVLQGVQNVQGCWRIRDTSATSPDPVYWWEQVLFRIVHDDKNRPIKAIGVSEDVTKEKDAQRDSLTSVFNRSSFEQKTSQILNERRTVYKTCAFLILDLDQFKHINDTYGHSMGDRVLTSIGSVLNRTFRSTDIIGRLGGDEFTIFMTSISEPEDAARKAGQLVENVSKIQEQEGFDFPVSCSVGVTIGMKGVDDLATMYKAADSALYEAKNAGKNQFRMHESN